MRYSKPNFALLLCTVLVSTAVFAQKQAATGKLSTIDIPYQKFILNNGLTLIVHEDHKVPIVAINVWYHVGSKNEKSGRTGFAHLFEHLMFNGSENFNDDYFQALERVGATDLNGTTNEDRTNYFQNVPTSAVDLALWMESDRMGHLVGAITQGKLDEQRGVVQNEKREGENQPYAVTEELIIKSTYPAGHPYAHSVIGSMEDLNAASLDDVKDWFKTSYGAANAVLVVAGDIDSTTALEKVKTYFGDIPSGPPVASQDVWVAKRTGTQREQVEDRVPQSRVYMVWNVPQWGSADADYLNLITRVLTSGKTSRLYKRLVYDDQIATDVSAYLDAREIGSQFDIIATVTPGGDIKKVELAINEELAKFLKSGPTKEELQRVKTEYLARFIRGIERIGGFGGKSDILAQNMVYAGSPDHYKMTLDRIERATTGDLLKTTKEWLSDGVYVLDVYPFPKYTATVTDTTVRKTIPVVGQPPVAKFPELHRATLSNGLKIVLAERPSIPVVSLNLQFDAGYASDQSATPGTANLAMNMLDEGTRTRSALAISEQLSMLGANLNTGSNLDMSYVFMSALKANLDASLDIFADVVLNPSFPQADLQRLQQQTIARIQREKSQPIQMALRIIPGLLYGPHHAYGNSFTGSGTEESVSKMKRDEMVKFHQTWMKPNDATLIVVGATTMDEIKPKLERLFRDWKPADVPQKNVASVEMSAKPVVYILDKPGALQSVILASEVAPPTNNPNETEIEAMNTILGSAFTSRINMNLRENKHWSYGAGSFLPGARGQRPFIAYGPVQTDKTKEAMIEMNNELRDILDKRPATEEELKKVQNSMTLELPGSWETMGAVSWSISELIAYDLADNYYETFPAKIRALSLSDIAVAAKKVIHPDNLVWVIVGDRSKIESSVRESGFGEVHFLDANGNVID
jgi:zinc protease